MPIRSQPSFTLCSLLLQWLMEAADAPPKLPQRRRSCCAGWLRGGCRRLRRLTVCEACGSVLDSDQHLGGTPSTPYTVRHPPRRPSSLLVLPPCLTPRLLLLLLLLPAVPTGAWAAPPSPCKATLLWSAARMPRTRAWPASRPLTSARAPGRA